MMKKLLSIFLILFAAQATLGQGKYPLQQKIGSDSTLVFSGGALKGRLIIYNYPDTVSANLEEIKYYPGALIRVGDVIYSRSNDATKWILVGSTSSALSNGLISTGGLSLKDSTLTINSVIKWSYNGVLYNKKTASVFTINSADSGYYRRDLIYADTSGSLYKLVGTEDTARAMSPTLPNYSVVVTVVDVYGNTIAPPVVDSIGALPSLQQVTDAGNTTTDPIFINNNSTQTSIRITGNFNRSYYLYEKNSSSGGWANSGYLFKNDVPDNPADEWSGHWFRLMMGSTTSSMAKDAAILMSNGTGGLKMVSDSGRITFNGGSPAYPYAVGSHPYKEFGAFETNGKLTLQTVDSTNAAVGNIAFFDHDTLKRGNINSYFLGNLYKKTGTDSLFKTIGGVDAFVTRVIDTNYNYVWKGSHTFNNPVTTIGEASVNSELDIVGYGGNDANHRTSWSVLNTGVDVNAGAYTPNFYLHLGGWGGFNLRHFSFPFIDANNLGQDYATVGVGNNNYTPGAILDIQTPSYHRGLPPLRFSYSSSGSMPDTLIGGSIQPYQNDLYYTGNNLVRRKLAFADQIINNIDSTTASNGLTLSGKDIQLGGTLTSDVTVNGNGHVFNVNNMSSTGTQKAVSFFSLNNYGATITSQNGASLFVESDSSYAAQFEIRKQIGNAVEPVLQLINWPNTTRSAGTGGSIDFYNASDTTSGTETYLSNSIASILTNTSSSKITSDLVFSGVNLRTINNILTLHGSGAVTLNQYGVGKFTGTPAYNLQVDAQGNIIETSGVSGTASNADSLGGKPASAYYLTTNPSNYITAAQAPVQSVAGKTGAVSLVEGDIANLTTDLGNKAPLASPTFTSNLSVTTYAPYGTQFKVLPEYSSYGIGLQSHSYNDGNYKPFSIDGSSLALDSLSGGPIYSGGTITAPSFIGNGLYSTVANTVVNPNASYSSNAANDTGAIEVILPYGYANLMTRMTIKVFKYNDVGFDLNVGGYPYSPSPAWLSTFAYITTSPWQTASNNYPVRFGYDSTLLKAVIYIGDTTTVWSYPQVFVTDAEVRASGIGTQLEGTWQVKLSRTLKNITSTVNNSQIGLYGITAATADNSSLLATTAYVQNQNYLKSSTASSTYLPLTGGTLSGTAFGTKFQSSYYGDAGYVNANTVFDTYTGKGFDFEVAGVRKGGMDLNGNIDASSFIGSGSSLTGITESQITNLIADLGKKLDTTYADTTNLIGTLHYIVHSSTNRDLYIDTVSLTKGGILKPGYITASNDTLATLANERSSATTTTSSTITSIQDSVYHRNYDNDSIAIVLGGLKQADFYRTGNVLKQVISDPATYANYVTWTMNGTDTALFRLDSYSTNFNMTIDWGDGNTTTTTKDTVYYVLGHRYSAVGVYTIKVTPTSFTGLKEFLVNYSSFNWPIIKVAGLNHFTSFALIGLNQGDFPNIDSLILPSSLTELDSKSNAQYFTDFNPINALPSNLTTLKLTYNNLTSFAPSLGLPATLTTLDIRGNHLTSTAIDNFLIWLDGLTFNAGAKTANITMSPAAPPTAASSTALSDLTSKGWTITHD